MAKATCEVNASVVSLSRQDTNSQVAGGGVSVYYSHVLQMLFFSYCQGRSFAATVSRTTLEVLQLFSINIKRWGGARRVRPRDGHLQQGSSTSLPRTGICYGFGEMQFCPANVSLPCLVSLKARNIRYWQFRLSAYSVSHHGDPRL